MNKYPLIAISWSLNATKLIKTMASTRRNGFHQKECTGGLSAHTGKKNRNLINDLGNKEKSGKSQYLLEW